MRILLTNDDGIRAEGLHTLASVARQFGEVKIVAPDRERSACGHGMTLREPLRYKRHDLDGLESYELTGVPTDCVNVGLALAWPDGCELVLSGINSGPNLGYDVTYSGTVAGAMEACIKGVPAIALSMAPLEHGEPIRFDTGAAWLSAHWSLLMGLPREEGLFWNINIPACDAAEVRGHRFVRMGRRIYEDKLDHRLDPWQTPYLWQGGAVVSPEEEGDTDVGAIREGYVALTPLRLDWTARDVLAGLRLSEA